MFDAAALPPTIGDCAMSSVHIRNRVLAVTLGVLLGGALTVAAQPASADTRPTAIVSLGDSAISGEGAGSYEAGTNGENGDWCHRSANAMVHRTQLADRTINLACSGANSANVSLADTTHYTEGSQARRLIDVARSYRVTTVLVEVGANDEPQFANTLLGCIAEWFNPFSSRLRSDAAHPVAGTADRDGAAGGAGAGRRPVRDDPGRLRQR